MHATPPLPADVTVADWSYHFTGLLGQGGFGAVWRAERTRDRGRQVVAVKVFHPLDAAGAELTRFQDELRFMLHHPHERFVHVHDVLLLEGRPAVVMELVDGWTCAELGERSVPERVVAEVGARVAEALVAAWEYRPSASERPLNLLHRDLKPGNLMLTRSGEVRVLDLGAAWSAPDYRDGYTHRGFGRPYTPGFAAPEVGRGASTPAEDVYGLGATLLAMRTGAVFLTGMEPPRALAAVEGEGLHGVLAGMLAPDPRARPTMEAVRARLDELGRALAGPDLRAWVQAGRPTAPPLAVEVEGRAPSRAGRRGATTGIVTGGGRTLSAASLALEEEAPGLPPSPGAVGAPAPAPGTTGAAPGGRAGASGPTLAPGGPAREEAGQVRAAGVGAVAGAAVGAGVVAMVGLVALLGVGAWWWSSRAGGGAVGSEEGAGRAAAVQAVGAGDAEEPAGAGAEGVTPAARAGAATDPPAGGAGATTGGGGAGTGASNPAGGGAGKVSGDAARASSAGEAGASSARGAPGATPTGGAAPSVPTAAGAAGDNPASEGATGAAAVATGHVRARAEGGCAVQVGGKGVGPGGLDLPAGPVTATCTWAASGDEVGGAGRRPKEVRGQLAAGGALTVSCVQETSTCLVR